MNCNHLRAGVCESCYNEQAPKEEPEFSTIEDDTEASIIPIGRLLFAIVVIASVIKGFLVIIGRS
jgi:hypothetical protein